jgi:hypothetical protein
VKKDDFKSMLKRVRAEHVDFDSYFQFHRPEYAVTHAWLVLQLQVRTNELLQALEKGSDARLARLAYDTAAIAGELKRLRVFTEVESGKTHLKARRQSRDTATDNKYELVPGNSAEEKIATMRRELKEIFNQLSPRLTRDAALRATAAAYDAKMRARGDAQFTISAKTVERHIGPLPRLKAGRKPAKKRR